MDDRVSASLHPNNVVTATDKRAVITITASLALVCMLLFLFARLHIRYPWKRLFGLDDLTTLVASIIGSIQTVVILLAVNDGLGRREDELFDDAIDAAKKLIYVSDILSVVAICLSKLAVAFLFHRLAVSESFRIASKVIGISVVICGFVSVLDISLRSENILAPWTVMLNGGTSLFHHWIAIGSMSIALEISLLLFPVLLVYGLQMSKSSKTAVVTGFLLRAPALILTVLRLIAQSNAHANKDQMLNLTKPTIYSQMEMHFNIMSATIPSLRVFLKSLNTGYYATNIQQVEGTATIMATKGSDTESYNLSDLSRHHHQQQSTPQLQRNRHSVRQGSASDPTYRPAEGRNTTSAVGGMDVERASVSSQGSERIIIRKTVDVEYGR